MNLNNIPEELKNYPNWVCWGRAGEKPKKPFNPLTGSGARPNDPESWVSYKEAAGAVPEGRICGRRVPVWELPLCGRRLRPLPGPRHGGNQFPSAGMASKTEQLYRNQPERDGLSYNPRGEMPTEIEGVSRNKISLPEWGEGVELEIYNTRRYFALTGNLFSNDKTINPAGEALNALYSEAGKLCLERKKTPPQPVQPRTEPSSLSDAEVLEKARKARNGADFATLYDRGDKSAYNGDDSRADMAL